MFVNILVILDPFRRFTPENESEKMQKSRLCLDLAIYIQKDTLIKETCRNIGLNMYNSLYVISQSATVIRHK